MSGGFLRPGWQEGDIVFRDLSEQVLQDDVLARLLTFPNVS